MVKSETIVLLTKVFPFATGEEFLEEEVEIISKYFNAVYIIATAVPYGSQQTRKTPSNVKTIALHEVSNRYLRYAKYVLIGVTHILQKDNWSEFKGKSAVGKLGVVYLSGRSRSLASKIANIPGIMAQLKKCNILLYSYWFSDLPYISILLKEKANNNTLKIVSRAHGYDLYEYRNSSGYIPFRKIVMSKIDKVYPCSKDGQKYLQNKFPLYAEKIEVSYLGTKDCGIGTNTKHDGFHIVTCSAIIPLKRLDLLAKAVKIIEEQGYTCKWTCIGDGPQFNELKAYVETNLKRCVVKFTGRIKHDLVLEILKSESIDLFVNVSETEGLPVSIMEATSFGIPILATDVGGTKEIVIPNITGSLLPKETTPAELAMRIVECIRYSFDREQIRAYWDEHFNSKKNYCNFADRIQRFQS